MNIDFNRPIILYMHAGSGNHGCEAIANTTVKYIAEQREKTGAEEDLPLFVVTNSCAEDRKYSLGILEKKGLCTIVEERHIDRHFIPHVIYYLWRLVTRDKQSFLRYRYKDAFKEFDNAVGKSNKGKGAKPLAISIGGDNYCYKSLVPDLILAHKVFIKRGFETILWGCSIEPKSLKDNKLVKDLMAYDTIYARESITYDALVNAGFDKDKLIFEKDPAFRLDTAKVPGINGFLPGNTVGINLSPMVRNLEKTPGITMKNYSNFIEFILRNTHQNIALIPHVVWKNNDDRKPLKELYDIHKYTGRVVMLDDMPAEKLKGYISKCSFFVGARTHSTIAAYSSNVPTLVIGYSVKSKGIAKDLFGTYKDYVLPVQKLASENALVDAYMRIMKKQNTEAEAQGGTQ
ncbi:polysaccharide pyruvyl transferase family protein [Butyrivibrio sp. M55]|uniref:polysaccharide pyruvyl transferase family protein n=1 Tax=Butyrivibrio sp. M55 TaxID=1855323 RepID=UPI0008EB7920|nr:polysaccharide pyruvyl transferase family protein [Butyrivibrio sp. M55]SFU66687.1 Polysaccharide pyruvyl transferase family protein WcaK [Butyrivibrio sp. M55]